MFKSLQTVLLASALLSNSFAGYAADALEVTTFNPGEASLFPVSSTLVSGPTEVMLVDAQFQRNDAQTLVDMINETGKTLTTVYISHGDPDFYFGLDVIKAAFPEAKILTSPTTQKYIKGSMESKLAYWGPILKDNAPQALILPDVVEGDTLLVDGQEVKIIGLDGHDPKHTFLWIPSTKTALGGVVLYENMHAWIADTQTPESRQNWYRTLDNMQALQPETVISGHYLGESSKNSQAIEFTRQYVKAFEAAAAQASSADDLKAKLNAEYPGLPGENELDISSKVIMGEMTWP